MKALITGATGFVGGHLHRKLIAQGWAVDALLRPTSDASGLSPDATPILFDGTMERLLQILADSKPDMVFHLASRFQDKHLPGDIAGLIESNVTFPTQLLEAMIAAGCRNIINTGTAWEHIGEDEQGAVCLYAATKQAFARVLRHYTELHGINASTLILFDTYGPDDKRGKVLSLLARLARTGEKLAMSPGEQLIDLVHIDDVTDAFIEAASQIMQRRCGDYAIGSGNPISLRDLAQLVGQITGSALAIEWGGKPYRPREVMVPWCHGAPLPGWTPRISLNDGLEALLR